MNESILKALMRLFAIVANVNKQGLNNNSRTIVANYLDRQLNKELVDEYLNLFDEYIEMHHRKTKSEDGQENKVKKQTSLNSVKVLLICNEINEALQQKEKILVLFRLLEFIKQGETITDKELDFIKTVADTFNVEEKEYNNIRSFVLENDTNLLSDPTKVLIINDQEILENLKPAHIDHDHFVAPKPKHLFRKGLQGHIYILFVESTHTFFFKYDGTDAAYLNGINIVPNQLYVLDNGSVIKSTKFGSVYYSDISNIFITARISSQVVFSATDIEFKFNGSTNGIQKFSFYEESGRLVGIMGGSGVGKSTLLSVFNGSLPLNGGSITINGFDLHKDKSKLEGVIGFVPQDDLLIEELSVFRNLYFNAKLCFSELTEMQIKKLVLRTLSDLDLDGIMHLTVGDPLNKFISGGQRKRLNIALELIREPSILIVDEPTSGLSSQDSDMVMSLLKEQTLKGRLVIVNIHQPSSDIFKMFDKLLVMDKGGHPVYYGNPADAVVYFKTQSGHVNADESECITCGNVNPEQILQILEAKVVNAFGKFTKSRKRTPEEWYELYKANIDSKFTPKETTNELPKNNFKVPNRLKQLKIFGLRNFLSKITNKQYLLINLLEAPILAVVLGYFTKYIAGTAANSNAYIFAENENIPAYLFMSVIVALFLGLTVSAEEIIRDRKILKREAFLNLSRMSYLNSKIVFLFALSAVQMLSYAIIGNWILGIHGMTLAYWAILFSTSAFANILGLNISSALNSVVTIYILIPFILVPQLSLSGVIVNFNRLHKSVTNPLYVPVIGDVMTSRWAYEALAVQQFKNNKYDRLFYQYDKEMSDASFKAIYLVPELESRIDMALNYINQKTSPEKVVSYLELVHNEISILNKQLPKIQCTQLDKINPKDFNNAIGEQVKYYLYDVKKYYNKLNQHANTLKDERFQKLSSKFGGEYDLVKLKEDYSNKRLAEIVLNKNEISKVKEYEKRIVRLKDPIYTYPINRTGRAHFYSPVKKIAWFYIDTFYYNIMFMWLTSILLYFMLLHDSLRKLIEFSERRRSK
ncbi:MAG TPA: ABC transporter [Bacteroidales bacterium]|nr:ABC transporter [Bacteroidales bacterium]